MKVSATAPQQVVGNTAEAYDEDDEDDLSELFSLDSWVGSSSDDSSGGSDNG